MSTGTEDSLEGVAVLEPNIHQVLLAPLAGLDRGDHMEPLDLTS